MSTKIKYFPINWADGMKVGKQHLEALENSYTDAIRDAHFSQLTDYNFGLIPEYEIGRDSLGADINADRVEIYKCRAVTRGGSRIEIVDMEIPSLKRPRHELIDDYTLNNNQDWYIVIKVNPFERVPFGEPDPEEQPLRHPYSMPSYELEVVSSQAIRSTQFLISAIPIAKITSSYNQGVQLDDSYIPPCSKVNGYSLLLEQYKHFEKKLSHIDGNLFEILKKIQRKKSNQEGNKLTQDIETIGHTILRYIHDHIDHYRMVLIEQPPIHLIAWFKGLARTLKSNLRFLHNREGMLSYFDNYIVNVNKKGLDSVIQQLCDDQYDHIEIQQSLGKVERLLSFFNELFEALAELNYEELAKPSIIKRIDTGEGFSKSQDGSDIKISPSGKKRDAGSLSDSLK